MMEPTEYATAFKGSAIKRAELWMLQPMPARSGGMLAPMRISRYGMRWWRTRMRACASIQRGRDESSATVAMTRCDDARAPDRRRGRLRSRPPDVHDELPAHFTPLGHGVRRRRVLERHFRADDRTHVPGIH